VAAIATEQSLIIPRGWFYAGRLLEVYLDQMIRVRLDRLVGSGEDFDRVTFSVA